MDVLFENRFKENDKMLSEYVHKVLCRKLTIIGYSFSMLALVTLIVTIFRHDYILAAIFGVCMVVLFFTTLITPHLTLKQLNESNQRLHNGKSYETIVRFDDRIHLEEGSISMSFEYSQILRTYTLKHSFVMMIGKTNAILISPENFTIGTFANFKELLSAKGIS